MNKGEIRTIKIRDLAHGGDGVGKSAEGKTIFVPYTAPGDLVKVKITKDKKNYAFAEITDILKYSEMRTDAPCPVYGDCGGCQIQHIKYNEELNLKKKNINDLMSRIGSQENYQINNVKASPDEFRYRNKAQFPLKADDEGIISAGFYRRGSHQVVPYNNCLIQHPLINRILRETLSELNKEQISVYNEQNNLGLLRHLIIRVGVCTNQALLIFVTNGDFFPEKELITANLMDKIPELKGVVQNINEKDTNVIFGSRSKLLSGQNFIKDYIGNKVYKISTRSFFQVNTLQAEKLYVTAAEFLGESKEDNIIDAYSGTGSIAVYLAEKVKKVFAVESLASAVKDGRENAELNNIQNIEFIKADVENVLPQLLENENIDTIIFDPPRKGLDSETIEMLNEMGIKKIIYISCNPSTQARDINKLSKTYKLQKIQPVDLFPQTYHIESVALLEKKHHS